MMDERKNLLDIKLIEEVKKNECLYNMMCPQYKDLEYKEHVWVEIGKSTGRTALESKNRWVSIRKGYKRSQHKTSVYKYAQYLSFLDDIFQRRRSKPRPEVSTDFSSGDEFQFDTSKKRRKYDFDNSLDVPQDILLSPATVDFSEIERLNFDTKSNTVCERTTEDQPKTHKITATEEKEQLEPKDMTKRLIEEVKKYDCIYNKQSDNYRNFEQRKHLWNEIGRKFGLNGQQANVRWRTVRDNYRRYKRKAKTEGFAKYKYAASLKFLEDYISFEPSTPINFSEAEVSTELSSDDEIQYKLPKKETEQDFQNSFEDMQDSWNESSTDANYHNDLTIQCTNLNQMIEKNEENKTTMLRDADAEEFSVSSDEEDSSLKRGLMGRIIEEVKKHDCIYNKEVNEYKNFLYKKRLWYKIGKRVGLTESEVRVKWKSLRDGYRKYKLRSVTEGIVGVCRHKYADSLRFLDDYMDLPQTTKGRNKLTAIKSEISTDLSSESDFSTNQELFISHSASVSVDPITIENVTEPTSATTITSRLFHLLANKIQEADLTAQQKNDIEYAVSAVVYSKLAEYNKAKT